MPSTRKDIRPAGRQAGRHETFRIIGPTGHHHGVDRSDIVGRSARNAPVVNGRSALLGETWRPGDRDGGASCPGYDTPTPMLILAAATTEYTMRTEHRLACSLARMLECLSRNHGNLDLRQHAIMGPGRPGKTRHGWLLRLGNGPPQDPSPGPLFEPPEELN